MIIKCVLVLPSWLEIKIKNLNGAIEYLFQKQLVQLHIVRLMKKIKKIDYALVISNVGGPGKFGYKQSFQKDSYINQEVENIFKQLNKQYTKYPFDISGSDERQFSTQGFKINSVSITKNKYYE